MDIILAKLSSGHWILKRKGEGKARRVCSVAMARDLLKKSTRQLYRYIECGDLVSFGKPFGDHLLDFASVQRLIDSPMQRQPVPEKLGHLFPEYQLKDLNLGRDRVLILGRVLELGDCEAVRWLLSRFQWSEIQQALLREGPRILSTKAFRFWQLFFKLASVHSSSKESPWHSRREKKHASS